MSYIGNSPGVASSRVTTTLTATAGQTVFTTQSGYVLGYVDVYLNGVKLVNGADFEAITGTYISLFAGALVGDVVELVSYVPRGLTDGYTKSEADAKFLDVGGDSATGSLNLLNVAVSGQLSSTRANSTVSGEGQLYLNGSTGNRIDWNSNGVAAPTTTTRSAGTKLVLYPALGASAVDYGLGVEAGALWSSIPGNDNGQFFKWYGGATEIASLSGTGKLTLADNPVLSAGAANGVTYLNGSKAVTAGSALTFDGTTFATTGRTSSENGAWIASGAVMGWGAAGTFSNYIVGDTASNYLLFQVNAAEGMRLTSTGLGVGTSSPANKLSVYAGGIVANFGAYGTGAYDDVEIQAYSGSCAIGTRGSTPLLFNIARAEKMRLDISGNLGLGVTPSAWGVYFKTLQYGNRGGYVAGSTTSYSGNSHFAVGNNGYFDSAGAWRASVSDGGGATQYYQVAGTHRWNVAGAVTEGNLISFTEMMNLSSGGLNFPTVASGNGNISFDGSTFTIVSNSSSASMLFSTNSTERARIDSSGNFIIGGTANYGLRAVIAGPSAVSSTGSGSYLVASLIDTNAMAAGVGGGLGFQGNDGANGYVTFASINGSKENSISGNYASYLSLKTRANGGSLIERLTINSNGLVTIPGGIQAKTPSYELYDSTYNEAGFNNSTNRIRLGTFYTAQGGMDTTIRLFVGDGYNAADNQVYEYVLRLRTSNGSSSTAGSTGPIYIHGFAERVAITAFGGSQPVESFIVEQITTDQYVVYFDPNSLIGNYSHYTVESPATAAWIHNPGVVAYSTITNHVTISTWRSRVLTDTSGFIANTRGISFPAIQSASSNANTLDDYEEGNWTPAWGSSGTTPTNTPATQEGRYVKIGRTVHFWARIFMNVWGSNGTGTIRVTGLPFPAQGDIGGNGTSSLCQVIYTRAAPGNTVWPTGATQILGRIPGDANYIDYITLGGDTNNLGEGGGVAWSTAPELYNNFVSGTYLTNS